LQRQEASTPLMRLTLPPGLPWHEQPPLRRADDVWLHYVGHDRRHQVLCLRCWNRLTGELDGGTYQAEHGGPVPLWSDQWRARHGIAPDEPCPMPAARLRRFTIAANVGSGSRPGPDGWLPPRTARTRIIRCGRCAGDFSPMFDLPDIVWEHYVPEPYRRHPVCVQCWHRLVCETDDGAFQSKHGGPLPLCSYPHGRGREDAARS
jgi:hypothetical protein